MKVSLEFDGLNELIKELSQLEKEVDGALEKAVYEGVGIVADAVREETEAIPEHQSKTAGGVRDYEREALLQGLGISPISAFNDDFLNAKVGFDGYFEMKNGTRKPIAVIARSLNAGTSFSQKYPFVRTAANRVKGQVKQAMQDVFEGEVKKVNG